MVDDGYGLDRGEGYGGDSAKGRGEGKYEGAHRGARGVSGKPEKLGAARIGGGQWRRSRLKTGRWRRSRAASVERLRAIDVDEQMSQLQDVLLGAGEAGGHARGEAAAMAALGQCSASERGEEWEKLLS